MLVRSTDGALAALLLDSTGEVVVEAGARDDRHRLIAVYQGILLSAARRALQSVAAGEIDYVLSRYEAGTVILRPLRDDYYVVVSLRPGSDVGSGLRGSAVARARMNEAM
jgi:predicted regulator of Ras-like GTPase activity (Roadblock/LC7/MglB family)